MSAVLKPVAGAGHQPHPGGRPRKHDRETLARALEDYIEKTSIPILLEWTTLQRITRGLVYDWPEFSTLIKRCTEKKKAALERAMLNNEVNTVGAIFSLKQLGWTDRTEQTHKSEMMKPEDMCAHLETLGTNLEKLLIRAKAKVNATVDGETVAPPAALTKPSRR